MYHHAQLQFFFFFDGLHLNSGPFMLARQAFYHLSHSASLSKFFFLGILSFIKLGMFSATLKRSGINLRQIYLKLLEASHLSREL
jgi:hypothetical protein